MPLTGREKKALIKRLDQDNDGRIDLIEYDMMVRQNRRKATQKQKQKQKQQQVAHPHGHKAEHGHGHGHQHRNGKAHKHPNGVPDSIGAIDVDDGADEDRDGDADEDREGAIYTDPSDADGAGTDDGAELSGSGKDIISETEKETEEGAISKEQLEAWAGDVHRKSQEDANALFAGARDQVAGAGGR